MSITVNKRTAPRHGLALAALMLSLLAGALTLQTDKAAAASMPDWAADFDAAGDAFEGGGGGPPGSLSSLHPQNYGPWDWNSFYAKCDPLLTSLLTGETECDRVSKFRWLIEPGCRDYPMNRSERACTDPSWWLETP